MASAGGSRRGAHDAITVALLLSALSLALPRITAGPIAPVDVVLDLVGWALVLGALWLVRLRRSAALQRWASTVLAAGFAALLSGMTLATRHVDGFWVAALAVGVLTAISALRAPGGGRVLAAHICLDVLVAVGVCWALIAGELPWTMLAALLAFCALACALSGPRLRWTLPPLAALFALAPGTLPQPAVWAEDRAPALGPDIVLVVADTLRHDSSMGMPSVRKLASGGGDWGAAQSSSSWTLPAMASVMTGTDVAAHGARTLPGGRTRIRDDVPTLAEQLAAAGYDTAAVLARNPNVAASFGLARGFDHFDFDGRRGLRFQVPLSRGGAARPLVPQLLFASLLAVESLPAQRMLRSAERMGDAAVVRRVVELLRARRDRPLFLWAHFMGMHAPHRNAIELEGVAPERMLELSNQGVGKLRYTRSQYWQSTDGQALLKRSYDNEAHHLDAQVQALLEALGPPPARGRLLIFTSDHGEELFDHGGYEHGHSYYQEVVGVPLVFAGDGAPARGRGDGAASLIDIAPTVLAFAGVAVPPSMSGLDLARATPEQLETRRLVMRNLHFMHEVSAERRGKTCAVRNGVLKAIHLERPELYDLARDPAELHDLSRAESSSLATLLGVCAGAPRGGEPAVVQEADLEALRALGYVQ
ncbi:MAG: sulfatase-like hydrolase/transferase [Myxococcales bacterium]|nr:sulfatase-like hydrolase/transferase [Myxococcales bacterium]